MWPPKASQEKVNAASSVVDYASLAAGLKTADWTQYIAPFWSAVIQSALQPRGWWALLRGSALSLPDKCDTDEVAL